MKMCKTDRLIFKSGKQKIFIEDVKNQTGLSWKELSSKINKSEIALRHELRNEKYNISYSDFMKLCDICKCPKKLYTRYILRIEDKNWGQKKGGRIGGLSKKHNMPRIIINKPKHSEKLAEFVGIMLGDGSISKTNYTIYITLNRFIEKHYSKYVSNLIRELFKINPHIFYPRNKNTIQIRVNSLELFNFLNEIGLVTGTKNKEIPSWIVEKRNLMMAAMRGLFDTDGSVYMTSKNCIMDYTITHKIMRKQAYLFLKELGVSPFIACERKINLTSLWKIKMLFKIIGTSNLKNIIKFNEYVNSRKTVLTKDVNSFVKIYKYHKLPYYYKMGS